MSVQREQKKQGMGDMTVDELKDKKLWFLWSAKPGRNGKVTKVPFAANGGATGTDDAPGAVAKHYASCMQTHLLLEYGKIGNESQDIAVPYGAFGYIGYNECVHTYRIR